MSILLFDFNVKVILRGCYMLLSSTYWTWCSERRILKRDEFVHVYLVQIFFII